MPASAYVGFTAADGADFDLLLQRLTGRGFRTVAKATGDGDKALTFTGRSGTYRYVVVASAARGSNGLSLLQRLRAGRPGRTVPVLVLASSPWDPVDVAVLLRTQSAIIRSSDGKTWRDQGPTWAPFVDDVQAVAYPG